MFSSEVLLREGRCRRAALRSASGFDTDLRSASSVSRSPCRIIDISTSGVRLRLYQDLAPNTSIRISLPGKGLVDARIVWADGREAGCSFDRPLDEASVKMLQASAERPAAG
jgi:hypothetical protein